MSFNNLLPLHVSYLRKRIRNNNYEVSKLRDGLHECDCEFCDRGSDEYDIEEIDSKIEEFDEENKLIVQTIARLKIYAKDRGIDLGEAENARS